MPSHPNHSSHSSHSSEAGRSEPKPVEAAASLPLECPELARRYQEVRGASEALAAPLSPEDQCLQSMPFASPTKWHLAHTTWYFETFILSAADTPSSAARAYEPFHPRYAYLFNSYYQTVGSMHARPERGLLSRPSLSEVMAYRQHVDEAVLGLLGQDDLGRELRGLLELGIHHEQQHQELMLTDIKHAFSGNPLRPAYLPSRPLPSPPPLAPLAWHDFEGGLREIGHAGDRFAFDNERPRHRVHLEPWLLASRPVSTGEYRAFMEDGGYSRPELWLSDGWDTVQQQGWRAPGYWERASEDDPWEVLTLHGQRAVHDDEPVTHVSLYEADAYARWAGARLPTEAEWECAAADRPIEGNFVESGILHPRSREPDATGPSQMFGDVWEWTASPYVAYPGYRAPVGPVGEYNGKFMCNQLVLRGGSCVSPRSHLRASYRNFFQPEARWQFSGIRLARDEV